MKNIHILVEGQTEDEFVRDILNDYLNPKDIFMTPILATTKRAVGGNPAFKGGIVSYGKVAFDIKNLLNDSSTQLVTTMIDFYGLPSDFPGHDDHAANTGSALDRVQYLESQFKDSINHPKFLPYLALHEFEALLFSSPETIVQEIVGNSVHAKQTLVGVRNKFNTPEDINTSEPPSKRITACLPQYDKTLHAPLIAVEITIDTMRRECSHFNEWLSKIEQI